MVIVPLGDICIVSRVTGSLFSGLDGKWQHTEEEKDGEGVKRCEKMERWQRTWRTVMDRNVEVAEMDRLDLTGGGRGGWLKDERWSPMEQI